MGEGGLVCKTAAVKILWWIIYCPLTTEAHIPRSTVWEPPSKKNKTLWEKSDFSWNKFTSHLTAVFARFLSATLTGTYAANGWNSQRTSPSSCKRGHERTQSVLKKLHNPAALGVRSVWCWEMCVRYCITACNAVGSVSVSWDDFMLSVVGRDDEGNLSLAWLMWDN